MADGAVDYRVLGPLEVHRAGERIEPTSPKQRALLLDLLIHRGRSVSRDRLIDDLWGEAPPATAPGVLQNYVSALRRILGWEAVRTVGAGYALAIAPGQTDADRFEHEIERARSARRTGDAAAMQRHSSAALALWRGEPLVDVAYEPFARASIAQFDALRGEAVELQLEAEILAGRPREAIPGLETAVDAHPLREQLWWLLMLALYRSGRQADALRTFQRARRAVTDQLGLDPSARLRDLEKAILAQDPVLDHGLAAPSRPRPPPTRPRSTAAAAVPPALVGRRRERAAVLGYLDAAWSGNALGLCLLQGEPGIGKTRLLEEAHAAAVAAGSIVLAGRSYEAETGRPFGAWIDALRSVDLGNLPDPVRGELVPLLPELGTERPDVDDPARLHDAVTAALAAMARQHDGYPAARRPPLARRVVGVAAAVRDPTRRRATGRAGGHVPSGRARSQPLCEPPRRRPESRGPTQPDRPGTP